MASQIIPDPTPKASQRPAAAAQPTPVRPSAPAPKAPTTRVNEMAKGKKKLEVIHLVCEETGDQNYTLRRKTGGEKLKVKKYSPRLRKHTVHVEKRK